MADQKRITLRQGEATAKNIRLYPLPVADAAATTTIYLTEFHATPKNIILRNPATAPVTGVETGESAAPLSATGVITAAGQKGASNAAPLSATGVVTAAGREGEASAAPLAAVGTITAAGRKGASSAAPLSAVGVVTAAGSEGEASSAPLSAIGTITTVGRKGASNAAPLSAVGIIITVGEATEVTASSLGGTPIKRHFPRRGKPYEPPHSEFWPPATTTDEPQASFPGVPALSQIVREPPKKGGLLSRLNKATISYQALGQAVYGTDKRIEMMTAAQVPDYDDDDIFVLLALAA